jgi:hypothetical protein
MAVSTTTTGQPGTVDGVAMWKVEQYKASRKEEWDGLLSRAKNASFLFQRDYMEYHANRFSDCSMMVYKGDELMALLPAHQVAPDTVVSHGGLTYGGFVFPRSITLREVVECFYWTLRTFHQQQITRLHYKQIPAFYNTMPAEDVDYVLFLLGAKLYRRDCALVVNLPERLPLRKGRKSEISKARRFGVQAVEERDFQPFWDRVLIPRLADRYGVKPVHSLEEITLLAQRFPANIRQFSAYCDGEIAAGVTIYETPYVAHAQYLAVTERGQEVGSLDYLVGWLISEQYKDKRHFDFGTCSENAGRSLNLGLLDWKEAFGGRTYCHSFYEIPCEDYVKLEGIIQGRLKGDGPRT